MDQFRKPPINIALSYQRGWEQAQQEFQRQEQLVNQNTAKNCIITLAKLGKYIKSKYA